MATSDTIKDANGAAKTVAESGDQRVDLPNISWVQYVSINDAIEERSSIRVIYAEGGLTFLAPCRKHVWFAARLGDLVMALAVRLEIDCEPAGGATFRLEMKKVGIEGDKTYYFREHAVRMFGPQNIDLRTQPPPDLAIEIERTHPGDTAMIAWGKLGVPEVWRYNPIRDTFGIWIRAEDGTYSEATSSLGFPGLATDDLLAEMTKAKALGASAWFRELGHRVKTMVERLTARTEKSRHSPL